MWCSYSGVFFSVLLTHGGCEEVISAGKPVSSALPHIPPFAVSFFLARRFSLSLRSFFGWVLNCGLRGLCYACLPLLRLFLLVVDGYILAMEGV